MANERPLTPLPIVAKHARAEKLRIERGLEIGTDLKCDICLPEATVTFRHCELRWRPDAQRWAIADSGSASGTFVNRRPITVAPTTIDSGDLIQVGSYAFIYNAADDFLVPVAGIAGAALHVDSLNVPARLRVETLTIAAGELTAITGPSGAGKSTLLQALAGLPAFRGQGRIVADGRDIHAELAWYRGILGYLSQDALVHPELNAVQALRFIQRLRLGYESKDDARQLLRELDVSEHRWHAPFSELSGGERQRVRIASELIARPRLLLLDEPASGLDPEREVNLMKTLRSLSLRGCTVVVVTHGDKHVGLCDQVIDVRGGTIQSDTPSDVGRRPVVAVPPSIPMAHAAPSGLVAQFTALCRREAALQLPRWFKLRTFAKLLVPALLVPTVFAVALDMTLVGLDKRAQLGFFCIVAAIWMGSSLSLLSIVGERPIFDHEHFLYLRVVSYVLAKAIVLGMLSVMQATVFFGLLWWLRSSARPDEPPGFFFGGWWVMLTLAILSWSGVVLGLFLSALAGRAKEVANLLLPLIMVGQIVFSAQVTGNGAGSLKSRYECFYWNARCFSPNNVNNSTRSRSALVLSYTTLSRPADIILCSFAYDETPPDGDMITWRREAWLTLISILVGLALTTIAILWLQNVAAPMVPSWVRRTTTSWRASNDKDDTASLREPS